MYLPAALYLLAALYLPPVASAAPRKARATQAFAIIIGVNRPVDRDLEPLDFADDDAARYAALFRAVGARTYVMTRPDRDTRKLYPHLSSTVHPPRKEVLEHLTHLVAADVRHAKEAGVKTAFYFVFAGHGSVKSERGYLSLEDGRLTGKHIERQVIKRVQAAENHVIIDACNSYYLAFGRGPGGRRRSFRNFAQMRRTFDDNVGLLLSTSSAQKSHEWEAFQAGVFSHEVRSGLLGAADTNGDGLISYREIAAFVVQANSAIANPLYRPQVLALPPEGTSVLLNMRPALRRRVHVSGAQSGHYLMETEQGVRLLDFHNQRGQDVTLMRPEMPVYLRRVSDGTEYFLPEGSGSLTLAHIAPQPARSKTRGAAHHAFRKLFSAPFSEADVSRIRLAQAATRDDGAATWSTRKVLGVSAAGVAVASLGAGIAMSVRAASLQDADGLSQVDTSRRNREIRQANTTAAVLYGVGGAAAVGSVLLYLWPAPRASKSRSSAAVPPGGAQTGETLPRLQVGAGMVGVDWTHRF